ncbi:General transcription and DNA repair factor IIH subunit TFB2 [Penicillium diatomitis]|uniref:RNA polymerase II transcription factor B subunit 2 n=1 Tax=Penicillium diatomitis TaxID=2819901 RepID=A0A9X0BSA5_9EURO|nr:General transcription and DNA repair factor IIH subunit TFB2 [Penicillium diatomitis]KAJ5480920.1 General transcription and DNA repair factor IIH subunit TFB2 [Penicillium diatomitis]
MAASTSRPLEYLEGLPGMTFNKLYQQPSTALAIFRRMLPDLAKCFVMALLYLKDPLPTHDLELWVKAESKKQRDNALSILGRLHILSKTLTSENVSAYMVTNPFADSLRKALTGSEDSQSFGVFSQHRNEHRKSISDLDEYARRQWEGVLGYMVGTEYLKDSGHPEVSLSKGVKQLLQAGHLVEIYERRTEITKDGFAFVLQDVNTQVWHILILYVESAEAIGMDSVEVLSFLFLLSSLELGQSYEKKYLSPVQLRTLADLADFGIIYQRSPDAPRFYPTRLATTLTSDSSALSSTVGSSLNGPAGPQGASGTGSGFIVIETNYRLYAYTSSPLQISLISLFTTLKYRFPNLITGKITRQSVRRAIDMGITADQIISYLHTHAHPQLRKHNAGHSTSNTAGIPPSILPPTVTDQIRLWQLERDRLRATSGFLFKEFTTLQEYQAPCQYAAEIGVLVWKSDRKRMFFVTRHEQVAAFLRSKK